MSTNDPWEAAQEAQELPSTYFGEVKLDTWFCVLEKGIGKVPFDAETHRPRQRRTAIDISLTPLPSRGLDFITERHLIAESRQWAGVVLPSIKSLGISAKELSGKWAQYEMVRTGRTWTDDKGETHNETIPKFLKVYQSLDQAESAAAALFGGSEPEPAPGNGNGHDPQRDVAAKFLAPLWEQA